MNFRRSIQENFSRISWGKSPEKFPGIFRNYFSYLIPLKIRKHGDLRISQEFLEKYSGEILRNFVGKNSEEFLRNFLKRSLKTVIPHKSLILGTNSSEILQRKSPRLENLGKFLTFASWVWTTAIWNIDNLNFCSF